MTMNSELARLDIIANIERMRAPASLTEGLELTESQQNTVAMAVADIETQGFAICENFLGSEVLERLRTELAPIFAITGNRETRGKGRWSGTQTVHVHNLFGKTRAADEVAIDPVVLSILESVLGPQFQMSVGTAMNPGPGADAQGFHQDDGHWPIPRPHAPLVANTLIALDDFNPTNGGTRLVPGSHKWTDPVDQKTEYVSVEMKAGSLLVWDGALWHAGGANSSQDQARRSINLNYNLAWLRQQENQYIGIPRSVLLKLPERLQRLLGYQKTNNLCGGVDYQDPLEYLRSVHD